MWQKLTTAALLGLGRSPLPEDVQQLLRSQGVKGEDVPEKSLLDGAALLLRQRQIAPVSATTPSNTPLPPDLTTEHLCNAAAEKALEQILNGTFLPALPEFLILAAARKLHLPPAYLPVLLEFALRDPATDALLQVVGGPRAAWLVSLNPRWHPSTRKATKAKPSERMSDADFNTAGLEYLALQRDLENGQPIVKLLSSPGYHWSDELAAGLVANFMRWLERHGVMHAWTMQHYRAMLAAAAYGCNALTCKAFEAEWSATALDAAWFRRIVAFRKDMTGALEV